MHEEYIHIPGEGTFSEVMPLNNGKKVIIYLSKAGENVFSQSNKGLGKYYLEQILNEDNQVISETIKENPHYIKDPY